MQQELLDKLRRITEEEQLILQGASDIQSDLYTTQFAKPSDFTVDSKKLLEKGCLIEVRPHTRFVHFPKHRHNYVELIYMCSGTTTHILNEQTGWSYRRETSFSSIRMQHMKYFRPTRTISQ